MLTMYLAGAIRDNKPEDIAWREKIIDKLFVYVEADVLRIISPLGGKHFDESTGQWTMSGVPSNQQHIVTQDFWSVDKADIIVFNLLPLAEGYASIGTLSEFGRSTASAKLRYGIVKPGFKGHQNLDMYSDVHPFLAHNMTQCFNSVESCEDFLYRHLPVIAGIKPWFGEEWNANYKYLTEMIAHA